MASAVQPAKQKQNLGKQVVAAYIASFAVIKHPLRRERSLIKHGTTDNLVRGGVACKHS